jgi:hypothetical protein
MGSLRVRGLGCIEDAHIFEWAARRHRAAVTSTRTSATAVPAVRLRAIDRGMSLLLVRASSNGFRSTTAPFRRCAGGDGPLFRAARRRRVPRAWYREGAGLPTTSNSCDAAVYSVLERLGRRLAHVRNL